MMSFRAVACVAVCLTQSMWMSCGAAADAWIQGRTDKSPVSYRSGEKMAFSLALKDWEGPLPEGGLFLDWNRTGDDGVKANGRAPLKGDVPFICETSIDRPGFVRLRARLVDAHGRPVGNVTFDGGAGADVDMLRPDAEPHDFDEFWARQFGRLDRVPMKAERVETVSPNPHVRLFAVRVDCAGPRPVTGYLSVPKAVERGERFPCRLAARGYTGNDCTHPPPGVLREDEIMLYLSVHGQKLREFGATKEDEKALLQEIRSGGKKYAFDPVRNADPESAYFHGMVLRVKRALQFLKTVPGWNERDLVACGGSQGGLQSIWAAGCGEGVTHVDCWIVWCCDMRFNSKRTGSDMSGGDDGDFIAWTDALGYYDALFFAKRIPKGCCVDIRMAGLGDYCSPPTGLAKLWNALACRKSICWVQGMGHCNVLPKDYPGRLTRLETK